MAKFDSRSYTLALKVTHLHVTGMKAALRFHIRKDCTYMNLSVNFNGEILRVTGFTKYYIPLADASNFFLTFRVKER